MKHYTTIEQSKKLLELGLSPESADMWYNYHRDEWDKIKITSTTPSFLMASLDDIPCWSVGALLELIPDVITIDNNELDFELLKGNNSRYYLGYCGDGIFRSQRGNSPIDTCFEMVCWLLKNGGYLKKIK